MALWALAGLLIVNFAVMANAPLDLPTQSFMASGTGKVLDAGAGSGRSALMVLLARPNVKVVALDKFAQEFGIAGNSPQRLESNLRFANVANRAEIKEGDMREMPFEPATFDGALSAYAIDHLGRGGFRTALGEVKRVLKPGGEFLFLTVNRDWYVRIAFPFMHHGYFGPTPAVDRWSAALKEGGFDIVETGYSPGTLYILCRKKAE
jgi:ubiquinone/menaquinone biosynthesis C-methylase UbiE